MCRRPATSPSLGAAPVLDPILFGALVVIVGLPAAALYGAVAFVGALGLALLAQRAGVEIPLDRLGSVRGSQADDGCDGGSPSAVSVGRSATRAGRGGQGGACVCCDRSGCSSSSVY